MRGALEHIGKLVLIALGSFGLLIVGYLMMPSLQQAIISIPFVMVGGYFLSAFSPQNKEVTLQ